ncbi:MAG: 50S ribosomal protein L3 [Parcubacteria group bacterium]|nr:MAG: 50S ribosomal protein L3 [Parcubacteria group bacterium]
MAKFILGKKLNMTQKFLPDGRVMPVTVVEAGPCTVVQVKGEKDGYQAVQIGFGKRRQVSKPLAGHLKGLANFRYLREFNIDDKNKLERGQAFDVTSFRPGDILTVTGVSKGKGFQGVVKRHGFHGHPPTHGHKDQERMPGSIGSTEPQRVFKGTRMAGHMGVDTITVRNLELIDIEPEKNLLYIKGAVPGSRQALLEIVSEGELTPLEKKIASVEEVAVKPEVLAEEVKNEVPVIKEETKAEEVIPNAGEEKRQ